MGTPVQITVTVDSNGAVTGFQQIGGAATSMGQEVSTSGLKGQAAIDALTKKWNEEQAMIAQVNARIKENMAAHAAQSAQVEKTSKLFQGLANDQTKASVAGRLLEQQLGLSNRALNQVAARSALLGPLMANMLPIGIAAAFIPMIISIGEGIAHAAQAAGGMTEAVKKMNEETVKSSQSAFLHPESLDQARKNIHDISVEQEANAKQQSLSLRDRVTLIQGQTSNLARALGLEGAILAFELSRNKAVEDGMVLDDKKRLLLEREAELIKQAAVDQATISAESSGLHGFQKLKFEEADAIDKLQKDKSLDAAKREMREYDVHYEFSQKRIELEQQESDKTIALRHQVEDETLHGTAKILADEQASIDALARAQQRSGGDYAQFQQQKVLLHLKALNQISALNNAADQHVKELQEQAVATALTGDDAIRESGEKLKEAEGRRLAEGLENEKQYNAAIAAINQATNNKIQAADQHTTDKHAQELARTKEMVDRAAEDMKTAQEDAALAAVPEWQRASAQIQIELNRRERAIEDQKIRELAAEHLTQDQILAINQDADAKRYDAIVQSDIRIREENKRLTESLGSDLQSVFDDIGSGNIGKRILANMEKMFFQIVAQWLLSLQIMKSAAGSILGSIVFGPGSTGAGVFGGGGSSILGSLFGGGGSAPSGAAFQPGGIFSDPSAFAGGSGASSSGLASAIAGTGAAPGGGVFASASNALTTSSMADALGGGVSAGAAGVARGASRVGGAGPLFSMQGMAGLAAVLPGLFGGFGGKIGQFGGMLGSLGLMGALNPAHSLLGVAGLGALALPLAAAGLDLMSFGVGSSHGKLAGGLLGWFTGGLTGLFAGIFGGIFGGNKRKKQANSLADNTLLPGITQISTGFDGFQVDSSSAIQQLEQLRTDSQKQLDALKSQGHDVFNSKVNPAIDAAEKHIRDTQSERDRRSAQTFGPPQFDTGGMFVTRGGSTGNAKLDDGEIVINPVASKKNLNTLAAINAGKTVSGITIHGGLNITANKLDRAYMMSSEFQEDLLAALGRASVEGKW